MFRFGSVMVDVLLWFCFVFVFFFIGNICVCLCRDVGLHEIRLTLSVTAPSRLTCDEPAKMEAIRTALIFTFRSSTSFPFTAL